MSAIRFLFRKLAWGVALYTAIVVFNTWVSHMQDLR